MKYTYDTIPAKLFFQAIETQDFSKVSEAEITAITAVRGNGDKGKLSYDMNLHSQMESLLARYHVVKYSVYFLRQKHDQELVDLLKEMRYKIDDSNLSKSLDTIDRLTEGLLIRINSIKSKLPDKEVVEDTTPLDEVIMSYCALLEMGFIDTNSVTLSQYDSLIKLGNKKMETLKKASNGGK